MIKLIVYDLDGTLVDSMGDISSAIRGTFLEMGLPNVDETLFKESFGHGLRWLFERLLLGQPESIIEEAIFKFRHHYRLDISRQTTVYPGIKILLGELESKSVQQAVLTNKFEQGAKQLLKALELSRYFDMVAGPDTFDSHKPDPRGLKSVLSYYGVSPSEAVMVGDSENDILAAKGAGVPAIGVCYGYRDLATLAALSPDYLLQSVAELSEVLHGLTT